MAITITDHAHPIPKRREQTNPVVSAAVSSSAGPVWCPRSRPSCRGWLGFSGIAGGPGSSHGAGGQTVVSAHSSVGLISLVDYERQEKPEAGRTVQNHLNLRLCHLFNVMEWLQHPASHYRHSEGTQCLVCTL